MSGWQKKMGGGGKPVPPNGVPWGVIQYTDFTALGNANFPVVGAYEIGGRQWWLKGVLSDPPTSRLMTTSLVSGQGLRISTNGCDYAMVENGRWYLPLSNIPEYRPGAPVIVLGQTSMLEYNAVVSVSIAQLAANSDSLGVNDLQRSAGAGLWTLPADAPPVLDAWVAGVQSSAPLYTALAGNSLQIIHGASLQTPYILEAIALRWDGAGDPDPFAGTRLLQDQKMLRINPVSGSPIDPTKIGAMVVADTGSAGHTMFVRKLWVMQPKVP